MKKTTLYCNYLEQSLNTSKHVFYRNSHLTCSIVSTSLGHNPILLIAKDDRPPINQMFIMFEFGNENVMIELAWKHSHIIQCIYDAYSAMDEYAYIADWDSVISDIFQKNITVKLGSKNIKFNVHIPCDLPDEFLKVYDYPDDTTIKFNRKRYPILWELS